MQLVGEGNQQRIVEKIKFYHMNKRCVHNPESVLENGTYKVLWYFEMQTNDLI